jgi:hypothetical protein
MKGIFCLEGYWYGDHRDETSVFPILDLINRYNKTPFVYHRCATLEEFIFSINRWKTKSFHKKYPFLYLGFHGKVGLIRIGKQELTIEDLGELLEDKCAGVVIYFGSCETMKIDKRRLQNFMRNTKTLAILGYKQEVDWIDSTSFDIKLLSYFLKIPFDSVGIKSIKKDILTSYRSQVKELDFRMEINDSLKIRRKRATY